METCSTPQVMINQKSKILVAIPARLHSKRLKKKLLLKADGYSIIQHTYMRAKKISSADRVLVITDSKEIEKEIVEIGGDVLYSKKKASSGTERIFKNINPSLWDVVVNLQGDEPLIDSEEIDAFILKFLKEPFPVGTLFFKNNSYSDFLDQSNVKLVLSKDSTVLYFSRSPIPFMKEENFTFFYHHIGVYAFKIKEVYKPYFEGRSELEKIEKLEQLRFLYNGIKVKAYEYNGLTIGIDTMDDFLKFKSILGEKNG